MPSFPLQFEGGSLQLAQLPSTTHNPQIQGSHQAISHSILLSSGVQKEQLSPPLHQNKALWQPQSIHQLLPKSASQSIQLKRRRIHSCFHQRTTGHSLHKYLVKYNITYWSKVLYQVQPNVQMEEAMKSSANSSFNSGNDETKPKPSHREPSIDF